MIEVAAAVIPREDGRVFTARRKGGRFDGCWEFPGGKVEPGETHVAALTRELAEEGVVALPSLLHVGGLLHAAVLPLPGGAFFRISHYVCAVQGGPQEVPGPDHAETGWIGWGTVCAGARERVYPRTPGMDGIGNALSGLDVYQVERVVKDCMPEPWLRGEALPPGVVREEQHDDAAFAAEHAMHDAVSRAMNRRTT